MNLNRSLLPSGSKPKVSTAWSMSVIAAVLLACSELVAPWMGNNHQLWSTLPVLLAAPIAYWLVRSGRRVPGIIIFMVAIGIQSVFLSIDLLRESSAITGGVAAIRLAFSITLFIVFVVFFAQEFTSLDIRTKIVIGILGTGGLALIVFIAFALYQAQQTVNALTTRLDASVSQLAEEQLINTAFKEADKANQEFKTIATEVTGLAQNWSSLRTQKAVLNEGPYWDARKSLFQLNGGQYGNSANDTSSVFVPAGQQINDALIEDLNISAYLDFYAPGVLQAQPSLLAVYAIDTRGVTRYYPNINLASVLPPDFDPTKRPYFAITSPLFNPKRLSRWTIPYVDATGGGLVVTVAAPVYDNDQFIGVIAADMQLTEIAKQISSITVGETGYAFMLDDAGRIISMPPAGFKMFGIRPEDLQNQEFFKETILGAGTVELQAVTKRMTSGGNGLLTVNVNGVDTYISFSPIKANGYSVALVVPVSELQTAIISARNQTEQQVRSATQAAAVILILLMIIAVSVSLWLGKIIAAPIQQLTQVASQITAGDLSVRAAITTNDEIGTLANSFNSMTSRLRETLDGLEHMVEERTSELLSANERNERRAKQFESIAQVASTISSTRDLDVLLPQITKVISREFDFYHVGIFLLDTTKEYAVLSAANSEGGQLMLARGHRLKVGEIGIVGYVTGTGKPRVALDTEADTTFFNNPNLPDTRSEMALPLRTGEEVIGALDVQSREPDAFSKEDINILAILADQVSIAIQNAKQFEQTRKALSEAEALAKQFVQVGWQQFTKSSDLVGVHHTGTRATLLYRKNGKNKEDNPLDENNGRRRSRGAFVSLPIKLRGEVIGSVDVRSPDDRPWDQDELDIITAILERAAIAMENARLLQESQRLAAKEAKIGEVTAKISASINMRNVLQTAVEELGHALPGSEVVIQFEPDQNKNKPTR